MRKFFIFIITIGLVFGATVYFYNYDQLSGFVQQYVENSEFLTLKARYTPEQIMEAHKKELLVDTHHSFQESSLKLHPYLLMDVKYTYNDKKSREGMILWSLVDGEMVINTDTWEKTHGFEDAINASASRNDFKLMYALAKNKGSASFEQLQKDLHLEKETLQMFADSALSKHLVIQKGNELQLHFQDPKLWVQPETKMHGSIVKKPYNHAQKVASLYSMNQIQKTAKAAFGDDFTVRNSREVYLPVYNIDVLNPDGSTFSTYWNAVTGEKMSPRYSLR